MRSHDGNSIIKSATLWCMNFQYLLYFSWEIFVLIGSLGGGGGGGAWVKIFDFFFISKTWFCWDTG